MPRTEDAAVTAVRGGSVVLPQDRSGIEVEDSDGLSIAVPIRPRLLAALGRVMARGHSGQMAFPNAVDAEFGWEWEPTTRGDVLLTVTDLSLPAASCRVLIYLSQAEFEQLTAALQANR